MKSITARRANQEFSKLLAEVKSGQEVVITSRGEPVAKMIPYRPREMTTERRKAIRRMMALVRKGYDLGGKGFTRDEMHER
jgi:prevent-host-death family protein